MDALTVAVLVAVVATVAALASGIVSMVQGGEVGHKTSAEWMNWRVALQAAAFIIVVVAIVASW